jgi:hypothetical protein
VAAVVAAQGAGIQPMVGPGVGQVVGEAVGQAGVVMGQVVAGMVGQGLAVVTATQRRCWQLWRMC